MTDNLFDQNDEQLDPNKDYLSELIGEGGKFYDPDRETALKKVGRGKAESDLYIKTILKQQDVLRNDYLKLREDYNARAKLEDMIDQYVRKPQSQQSNQDNTPNLNDTQSNQPQIDPKQIESLVSSKIQEHESNRKQSDNYNQVRKVLEERLGTNYKEILKQQANDLGLTDDDVNALARKSPAAFLQTFRLDQPEQRESFQTPPRSNQRNDNFAPKGQTKRTWSYYQKMKKENPALYLNPKTSVQMHRDYADLGPAFEDGDFNA